MEPSEAGAARQAAAPADELEALSASARGWHAMQMGVLGFIGICGVLRTADSPAPRAVQWLAAALAVAALAVACLAIFTVGQVAYPVNADADSVGAQPGAGQAAARLRGGIRLTVVAVILAVIAALSGWWPAPAKTAAVAVTGTSGQGLVRSARKRARRRHKRQHTKRRRHRARPGHRRGPPRRPMSVVAVTGRARAAPSAKATFADIPEEPCHEA